jgi:hypothetical protein
LDVPQHPFHTLRDVLAKKRLEGETPEGKIVSGSQAEAVWERIFREGILPYGEDFRAITATGDVAIGVYNLHEGNRELLLGIGWDGESPCFRMDPKFQASFALSLATQGDEVGAQWLGSGTSGIGSIKWSREGPRTGRIFLFADQGTFMFNLDVTKDPTLGSSYSIEPGTLDSHRHCIEAARDLILPALSTGHNVEVTMMSLARFAALVGVSTTNGLIQALHGASKLDIHDEEKSERWHYLLTMIGFGLTWRQNGFARLEVGHKLASALMFTDAPDSVQSPWPCWSLIVPNGLLGDLPVQRIWCFADRPAVLLISSPSNFGLIQVLQDDDKGLHEEIEKNDGTKYADQILRALPLLRNLIRGVCLTLSDPSEWRKGDWYGKPSGSEIKKPSKHKELPVGERYVVGAPVKIDLREEVLEHMRTGRVGGSSPTKLFLVRGHWRRQAHGPKASLRKTIWVEPFWKGPEEARVLLRPYQANDSS